MALVNACRQKNSQLHSEFEPCFTQFRFANSQTIKLYDRLVIHLPMESPCRTEIEISEEGSVPILVSLDQMRNLYMEFKHPPQCDYMTCAAFGMKEFPLPISTTNHLLLDLASLTK